MKEKRQKVNLGNQDHVCASGEVLRDFSMESLLIRFQFYNGRQGNTNKGTPSPLAPSSYV